MIGSLFCIFVGRFCRFTGIQYVSILTYAVVLWALKHIKISSGYTKAYHLCEGYPQETLRSKTRILYRNTTSTKGGNAAENRNHNEKRERMVLHSASRGCTKTKRYTLLLQLSPTNRQSKVQARSIHQRNQHTQRLERPDHTPNRTRLP